jgi:hypothetical protein
MKSEPVLTRNDTGSGAHRVYRASITVPAASGAPVTLIACALDRVQSINELIAQLEMLRTA